MLTPRTTRKWGQTPGLSDKEIALVEVATK
jgi:hypothetical protein